MSGLSGSLAAGQFTYLTPSGVTETTVFRNGFQYTLLVRGDDIRRTPGIVIHDVLNNTANTCTFTIDGNSSAPIVGEKIEIRDEFDGDRLLFAGIIQTIVQKYEGQIDQLVWDVTCVDFTWLLNRRRPFGVYNNVSASDIVKDLIARFGAGFTTNHVQTNLAKVTIRFDGGDDFGTCLTKIAQQIGGGHWDVDYFQDLHFFHVVPSTLAPPLSDFANLGNFMTISEGVGTAAFTTGYYFLRYTFLYDDGSESAYGAISNVMLFGGTLQMNVTGLPTGVNKGSLTCVGRRVYYNVFYRGSIGDTPIENVQKLCQIDDNTSTGFTWFGGTAFAGGAVPMAATVHAAPVSAIHPVGPATAPSATIDLVGPLIELWYGMCAQFKVAFLYRDGSVSAPSPASNTVKQLMVRGYGIKGFNLTNIPVGDTISNNDVVARFIYYGMGLLQNPNWSGSWPGNGPGIGFTIPDDFKDPTWADPNVGGIVVLPDNTTTSKLQFSLSDLGNDQAYFATVGFVNNSIFPWDGALVGRGNKPYNSAAVLSVDPIPIWPNPDGPSLEDVDPPHDINEDDMDLLREEAGNPFTVTTDLSQVRNRVFVIGSGSATVTTAEIGAAQLQIADISTMSPSGGKVIIEDPLTAKQIILSYNGITGVAGTAFIVLATPITTRIVQGCTVNNFFQADDVDSQKFLGKVERDKNGNPTDGIHEFTVVDGSLKATFQLYMRAFAELELFGKPIVTISYSTRDPKTKTGQTVHVDLDSPPCQGDFLIQTVDIDQIRDEGDQLEPRYTVTASSVKFELNDLLLQIVQAAQQAGGGSSTSSAGFVQTSVVTVGQGNSSANNPRSGYAYVSDGGASTPALCASGLTATLLGGTLAFDGLEIPPMSDFLGSTTRADWGTLQTSASVNTTAGVRFAPSGAYYLEDNFDMTFHVKTPAALANICLWVGLQVGGGVPQGARPINSGCVAFRFYNDGTSLNDAGWVALLQAGGVGHTATKIPMLSIAPSSEYLMSIKSSVPAGYSSAQVTFTINGVSTVVHFADTVSSSGPGGGFDMPTCNNGGGLMPGVGVCNKGLIVRKFNFRRFVCSAP